MKVFLKTLFRVATYVFAVIGLVFTVVFAGMQFGLFNVRGSNTTRNASLGITTSIQKSSGCLDTKKASCEWTKTVEWDVLNSAFQKDASVINRVSQETGVSARMIVATATPEQLRFFTANRESFKKYFEPLKILSSLTKFSLGVSGIKEETALKIEEYANDPTSDFYPGADMAALIAYQPTDDHSAVLYSRLTDQHNHYYSYLYTALYIKEIQNQWEKAGFDVSAQPGVITTLFNLGFNASHPNANPTIAGSSITLGGKTYSYGELGTLFYESDELISTYPRK